MNSRLTNVAAEAWGAVSEMFFKHGRPKIMSAGQDSDALAASRDGASLS